MAHKKLRGRPLLGTHKKARASYTLPPGQTLWLHERAIEYGISQSALLERILDQAQRLPHIPRARVRISLPHDQIATLCQQYGVQSLKLFGSVLRADFNLNSDIDVLVEFAEAFAPSYLTVVALETALTKLLGRPVDLHTAAELSPHFQAEVLSTVEEIYHAE